MTRVKGSRMANLEFLYAVGVADYGSNFADSLKRRPAAGFVDGYDDASLQLFEGEHQMSGMMMVARPTMAQ